MTRRVPLWGVAGLALLAGGGLLAWQAMASSDAGQVRAAFPSGVPIARVIETHSMAGMREGCVQGAVALEAAFATDTAAAGLPGLAALDRTRSGAALSAWRAGPIPTSGEGVDMPVTADGGTLYALPGVDCGAGLSVALEGPALDALDEGRAYYASFNSGEGVIILAPELGIGVYYYRG